MITTTCMRILPPRKEQVPTLCENTASSIDIKAMVEKQRRGVLLTMSMLHRTSHTRRSAHEGSQEQLIADSAAAQ